MMRRIKILSFIFLGVFIMAFSYIKFDFKYPEYFPVPRYNFEKNPLSQEKIDLGRALFYDPILSKDNFVSCASCHSPYNAFAHTDHDLSHGIDDQIGNRNAPPLFNLAWHKNFMWDGSIHHLDQQALAPISDPKEMGEDIKNVVAKLNQSKIYPSLFYSAFGDSLVTGEHLLKAISQFQLTLVSFNSKYDKVKRGEAIFTEQEEKGYKLFQQKCNSCHAEPLFTNGDFANNGLSVDTTLFDFGRWTISKKSEDSLLFKVPSLRNLSFTYPYMHDGRFYKLREVLNHYGQEVQNHKTLSNEIKEIGELNSNEKVDLISFLLSLNDTSFVLNRNYAYPFKILNPTEGN